MSRPTALYRLYSADNQLLYIGIGGNAVARFEQHRVDKPWAGNVARIEVVEFEDRQAALDAEAEAIKAEEPLYNIQHNIRRRQVLEVDEGPQLLGAEIKALKGCLQDLPDCQKQRIRGLVDLVVKAGRSISLSERTSMRRAEIAWALIHITKFSYAEEILRAFFGLDGHADLGLDLGAMTIEQARALKGAAACFWWHERQRPTSPDFGS